MRITWKPTENGFTAAITSKHPALKGWAPMSLSRRNQDSDGFRVGTWQLTGPVKTNLWAQTAPEAAKEAASKMLRAYCAAMPEIAWMESEVARASKT